MTSLVETLDYEALVLARRTGFAAIWQQVRVKYPSLPNYDVQMLETDPISIVLEASASEDLNVRARINDAVVKANLYQLATGDVLDLHAGFYDVVRLVGETDIQLRRRIELAIVGRSTGGTVESYSLIALGVAANIADVRIGKVNGGPSLKAAILTSDNGGIPTTTLLNQVQSALNSPSVLCVNDSIIAVAAINMVQPISAKVFLLPSASQVLLAGLEAVLKNAWSAEGGIGIDLEPSWIIARLMVPGVSRIELLAPLNRVVAADDVAIGIGTVAIANGGVLQ